jgi:hypothetical protein
MKNLIVVLMAMAIVAAVACAGVVLGSSGGAAAGTTDIGAIVDNPGEWFGEEVTVEGLVVTTSPLWFVVWSGEGPSITVRTTGDAPANGTTVRVEGTARSQDLYGFEQAYIFARSWDHAS